jgi:parallel beta-helix repeat protein
MKSKFNLLVVFFLLVICCLVVAIYYQSKILNRDSSKFTNPKLVKELIVQQIPGDSDAKETVSQIYYIDSIKGDNRAVGTSMENAWQDLSRLKKVSFLPGDKILLKRGAVWNQPMIAPEGGTEKHPIVIDAYGSGSLPVIDVQNKHSFAIRVIYSHTFINNIRTQNSKQTAIIIAADGGLKNVKLNKVKVFNSGQNGIGVFKGGTKITITDCYVENVRNCGIFLSGSAENKLSNVIVSGCHIKGVANNDGITIHEDSERNTVGSNFLLKNNIAEMCGEQGFDITSGKHVLLLNNISKNNKQGGVVVSHSAQKITIKGHISTDEPTEKTSAAINLAGGDGNIRLLNSIIKGNGHHLLSIQINNVAVLNNNFIWNGGKSPIDISGKIENIYFLNNIIYSKQNKMSRIRFLEASRPPNYKTFNFDYNLYYVPDKDVMFYYNKKNYDFEKYQKTFNVEMHSQNSNPEFVNSTQDKYQVKKNSPAIDKGCFYTHPLSQDSENTLLLNSALSFYKSFNSADEQCIMFKGINGTFNIVDVNYQNNSIKLDKNIKVGSTNAIGLCYSQTSLDIGAYEFANLPLSSKSNTY